MSDFKFSIKVGDKILLNEKPDGFDQDFLVVTEVFYDPSYYARGVVVCGDVAFEVDGSTWGSNVDGQSFKREIHPRWDESALTS